MLGRTTFSAVPFLASLVLFTPLPIAAAETATVCDAKYARQSLRSDDLSAICDCQEVTVSFISRIQRDRKFGEVLDYTFASCPLLAGLLTDTATASFEDEEPHERGGDPVDFPPEDPPSEPPSEPPVFEIQLPDNGFGF